MELRYGIGDMFDVRYVLKVTALFFILRLLRKFEVKAISWRPCVYVSGAETERLGDGV